MHKMVLMYCDRQLHKQIDLLVNDHKQFSIPWPNTIYTAPALLLCVCQFLPVNIKAGMCFAIGAQHHRFALSVSSPFDTVYKTICNQSLVVYHL